MAKTVKTAVSIPTDLAGRAEALAADLEVSRSRLFALALEEYVQKHENAALLERLNAAYADHPDAAERELLDRTMDLYREILETEK